MLVAIFFSLIALGLIVLALLAKGWRSSIQTSQTSPVFSMATLNFLAEQDNDDPPPDPIELPSDLEIVYCDFLKKETVRKITLKTFNQDSLDPSIDAYCHLRKDERTFKLCRIKRVIDLNTNEDITNRVQTINRYIPKTLVFSNWLNEIIALKLNRPDKTLEEREIAVKYAMCVYKSLYGLNKPMRSSALLRGVDVVLNDKEMLTYAFKWSEGIDKRGTFLTNTRLKKNEFFERVKQIM